MAKHRLCFPMNGPLLLAVHLEKLSVNRPLTQKTGPLKPRTIGSGALDALVPLSPFHCAMTRTNCIHRPFHKNILGPWVSDGDPRSMVV